MNIRGYKVVILDGPAEGWGYTLAVPPEPEIAVAPMPEGSSHVHGKWMRVPTGEDQAWPGQRTYRRDPIPVPPPDDVPITSDGDLLCRYRVVDDSG